MNTSSINFRFSTKFLNEKINRPRLKIDKFSESSNNKFVNSLLIISIHKREKLGQAINKIQDLRIFCDKVTQK